MALHATDPRPVRRVSAVTASGASSKDDFDPVVVEAPAVKLMVAAWSQIGTVEAGPVALALRALPRWVWGNTTVDFEDNGDIKDVAIRVEKLDLSLPGKSKIVYSGEQ